MLFAHHPRLARLAAGATLVCAFACAGACAGGPPTSGILGDYSSFKKRSDGMLVDQVASPEELARYKRVMLTRALVYLEPGSEGAQIAEADKRALGKMFDDALSRELSSTFEVVRDPGQRAGDVMKIQAAITDVHPGGEGEADLGNATVEVEVVDSVSGERLVAAVSRKQARQVATTKAGRMDEAEHVMDEWAAGLRRWLEEAMQP